MVEILPNSVYSYKEAQELVGVKEWILSQAIKEGQLTPSRLGKKKYYFLGADLLEYLEKSKTINSSK